MQPSTRTDEGLTCDARQGGRRDVSASPNGQMGAIRTVGSKWLHSRWDVLFRQV